MTKGGYGTWPKVLSSHLLLTYSFSLCDLPSFRDLHIKTAMMYLPVCIPQVLCFHLTATKQTTTCTMVNKQTNKALILKFVNLQVDDSLADLDWVWPGSGAGSGLSHVFILGPRLKGLCIVVTGIRCSFLSRNAQCLSWFRLRKGTLPFSVVFGTSGPVLQPSTSKAQESAVFSSRRRKRKWIFAE